MMIGVTVTSSGTGTTEEEGDIAMMKVAVTALMISVTVHSSGMGSNHAVAKGGKTSLMTGTPITVIIGLTLTCAEMIAKMIGQRLVSDLPENQLRSSTGIH